MSNIREITLRWRGIKLFKIMSIDLRKPGISGDLEELKGVNKFMILYWFNSSKQIQTNHISIGNHYKWVTQQKGRSANKHNVAYIKFPK